MKSIFSVDMRCYNDKNVSSSNIYRSSSSSDSRSSSNSSSYYSSVGFVVELMIKRIINSDNAKYHDIDKDTDNRNYIDYDNVNDDNDRNY